jgi:hypothetical protein
VFKAHRRVYHSCISEQLRACLTIRNGEMQAGEWLFSLHGPARSEYGTYKTVKARFWPCTWLRLSMCLAHMRLLPRTRLQPWCEAPCRRVHGSECMAQRSL